MLSLRRVRCRLPRLVSAVASRVSCRVYCLVTPVICVASSQVFPSPVLPAGGDASPRRHLASVSRRRPAPHLAPAPRQRGGDRRPGTERLRRGVGGRRGRVPRRPRPPADRRDRRGRDRREPRDARRQVSGGSFFVDYPRFGLRFYCM